jgi:hypothetical protein
MKMHRATRKVKYMKMTHTSTYEPPAAGKHVATLTKITDLGIQKTAWGDKSQVRLRFEVAELDSRGAKKFVTRTLTNSLHELSNFCKFFAEIGKPLPPDGDLDTNTLIGTKFSLVLKRTTVDNKIKVRIESVGPLNGDAK